MKKNKIKKGFSIVELLVVISIFAVIGVLSTRSLFLTLRNSKKSDSLVRVRENVNYSLSVIERQIRNAETITPCNGASSSTLSYVSIDGSIGSFTCNISGTDKYIASGSARLTSNDISITSCNFVCTKEENKPSVVTFDITAIDNTSSALEKGNVTSSIEIVTRNY